MLLASLALSTAGCGADFADAAMETTTETLASGATLVRHSPPPDGPPVTWRLEEEHRIGTMAGDGPDQFGDVAGIAVTDDGSVVVLDRQAQELRIFDADGRHLRTFGGKGGGPGEMEGANGVRVGPDGLLRVPDSRNTRFSFFDVEAGFVRSHTYEPMFMNWIWDGVVDEEGSSWSIHWIPGQGPDDRGYTAYVGYDTAGVPFDTLRQLDEPLDPRDNHAGMWNVESNGVPLASLAVPFYPQQRLHLDRRLRLWVTGEGDPEYRLMRWTAAGDTTLVLEMERPLQPSDRALGDSIAANWEEQFNTTLDRSKIPEVAPTVIGHFVDDDDRLWVQARTPDSDSIATFDVYDTEDGSWLGTLATPLRIRSLPQPVIRGDRVWAVVTDELDVPYVVSGVLREAGAEGDV